MNRMFNNMWSSSPLASQIAPGTEATFFHPEVEMSETNGHIDVSAEIPGVSEKDIDLTLSPDGTTLSIKGEKKLSKEKKDKDYYYAERSYGEFRRTMTLPCPVNPDKVDAKFHNGVLEVKLTKVEDSSKGVKRIAIKAT
jgi:HSP20 family protein